MRLQLNRIVAGLALAAGCGAASAIDLLQAWRLALDQDATIQASRAATDARKERLPQAYSQLLPNVSASFSRNKNDLTTVQPDFLGQPSTSEQRYFSAGKSITLRQPLYRPFQSAAYQQAKFQVDDALALLDRDTQNVAVRVAGAYFEALLANDQRVLMEAQRVAVEAQLDGAKRGFAAGVGVRTDVDEAQARLDLVTAQMLEANQNVDLTRRQLEFLINEPLDNLAVLDPVRLTLSGPDPETVDAWIEKAESTSPEIRSLTAQVEAAKLEVDKARAGHKPTLDFIAQRSRSESENVTRVQSSFDNTTYGIQLAIPLYGGGLVNSQVRQAEAELARAQYALEAGKRDLALRVTREYRGVSEGVLRVKALEQSFKSSELLATSSRKSQQAGSRTIVDVLNTEQQKAVVARDLAQARYLYLVSRIRLQALAGMMDEPQMQSINDMLTTPL